ncbi:MAG: hypothetical protein AB7G06_06430 [Bdellovibrionales bacterium]
MLALVHSQDNDETLPQRGGLALAWGDIKAPDAYAALFITYGGAMSRRDRVIFRKAIDAARLTNTRLQKWQEKKKQRFITSLQCITRGNGQPLQTWEKDRNEAHRLLQEAYNNECIAVRNILSRTENFADLTLCPFAHRNTDSMVFGERLLAQADDKRRHELWHSRISAALTRTPQWLKAARLKAPAAP